MSTANDSAPAPAAPTGPAWKAPLIIAVVALALRFVPGWLAPFTMVHFMTLGIGPVVGLVGLLTWWALNRRVRGRDKWLGLALGVGVLLVGFAIAHPSMFQFLVMHALPLAMAVFVVALLLTREVAWPKRRWLLILALAVTLWPWSLLRQDGQIGALTPELAARWAPTAEDLFLEGRPIESPGGAAAGVATAAEWPGFRGPHRDGKAQGARFDTDWGNNPPRELWRRRVGPGWSSFAVAGDLVFTQEQRGEEEAMVAYGLADGREVWVLGSPERFEEPASGVGPRATPTVGDGTVYALGAYGTLLAADATNGERRWRRSLREDVEAIVPVWGFTSSPLVMGRSVMVFAGADEGHSVVAYHRDTGDLLWSAGDGRQSYGSVHGAEIGGVDQALMASDVGLQAFDPDTGDLIWQHRWPLAQASRIVQPVVFDGTVILGTGFGEGSRRLDVSRAASGEWTVAEAWTSRFLKPYFNDLVCHQGTCYGFDNKIFTAIGAGDGERRWKGGRYGHGQVLLVPEMDLLLVITERGEAVLVAATPEEHREVARFQALAGKTWNHPVITGGKLLVRNAEEAACFELGDREAEASPPRRGDSQ